MALRSTERKSARCKGGVKGQRQIYTMERCDQYRWANFVRNIEGNVWLTLKIRRPDIEARI